MTVLAHLASATLRAASLSDDDTCLYIALVPGGLSVCGRRGERYQNRQLPWDAIDVPVDPVTPLVDEVRRALMVARK